jgi:NADH-quinone oxidoreductase E subunit
METVMKSQMTDELECVSARYPANRAALLPALYLAQRKYGWLSVEAMDEVSRELGVPKATVRGVATFYAMYRQKPVGRNVIQLCTNVSCMILGAERLVDIIRDKYGVEPGGTSADGRFSLVIMECIGACGTAPAMLVNTDFHESLTPENIVTILEGYR